ncbi:hypothetical protein KGF54_004488 [Candida jiufengensis]|uniref:uncharacterized protein n=1 Tax=Candida jiufengensis TaxID=497108 RepID=UPI002224A7A5|nr:uncharacterized protein KGF54_004488 [Candida jiufengensis]KAI5951414.1 hypothetical protein KGF54_004488 [Candida jiufengensis]
MARKADSVVPEIEVGRRATIHQQNTSRLSSPILSSEPKTQNKDQNLQQKYSECIEQNEILTKRNRIFSLRITELENKIKSLNKEISKLKENEILGQSLIEIESNFQDNYNSFLSGIQQIRQKHGLKLPVNKFSTSHKPVKIEPKTKIDEAIPQYFKKDNINSESSKISSDKFINISDESDYEDETSGVRIGVFAKQRSSELHRNDKNSSLFVQSDYDDDKVDKEATITKDDEPPVKDKTFDKSVDQEISFMDKIKEREIEEDSEDDLMTVKSKKVQHKNDIIDSDLEMSGFLDVQPKNEEPKADDRSERRKTRLQKKKTIVTKVTDEEPESTTVKRKARPTEAPEKRRKPLANKTNTTTDDNGKKKRENRFKNCDLSIFDFE